MKLNQLYEDYRSGPSVFPCDTLERAQSYKGPTDNYPKKKKSKKKKKPNKKRGLK
jgi:hypothetical protein